MLYFEPKSEKVMITVYGCEWEKDKDGKVTKPGTCRKPVARYSLDLSRDIWNLMIKIEDIKE